MVWAWPQVCTSSHLNRLAQLLLPVPLVLLAVAVAPWAVLRTCHREEATPVVETIRQVDMADTEPRAMEVLSKEE